MSSSERVSHAGPCAVDISTLVKKVELLSKPCCAGILIKPLVCSVNYLGGGGGVIR